MMRIKTFPVHVRRKIHKQESGALNIGNGTGHRSPAWNMWLGHSLWTQLFGWKRTTYDAMDLNTDGLPRVNSLRFAKNLFGIYLSIRAVR